MRELSLDRLKTLVAIVDLGSFAAAARYLHLSPPTVSLHVADLEARVGAAVLTRARGHVTPTSVGETLTARARRLLADADQALDDVQRQVQGLAGRVRLGASTGAIVHLLPQALEILASSHPDIDVEVAVLTSQESLARLSYGALDIALVAMPIVVGAGLTLVAWRRDPVMAFVPARWQAPACLSPGWLANCPLILNDSNTRLSRITTEWFAAAGLHPRARIHLNYNDAIKSLVAAGFGATLLPQEANAVHLDERIAMRPLAPPLWRPLGVAYRKGTLARPVLHVLDALGTLRQT